MVYGLELLLELVAAGAGAGAAGCVCGEDFCARGGILDSCVVLCGRYSAGPGPGPGVVMACDMYMQLLECTG